MKDEYDSSPLAETSRHDVQGLRGRCRVDRVLMQDVVTDRRFLLHYCGNPFSAVKAVCGDKVHIIDRFHVVQQAVSAHAAVLRSVQKQRDHEEAKTRKKLRKRWLKSAD